MEMEFASPQLVHCYDIERHRVLCGLREQTGSTKHVGAVTCPECLRLLAGSASQVGAAPADTQT